MGLAPTLAVRLPSSSPFGHVYICGVWMGREMWYNRRGGGGQESAVLGVVVVGFLEHVAHLFTVGGKGGFATLESTAGSCWGLRFVWVVSLRCVRPCGARRNWALQRCDVSACCAERFRGNERGIRTGSMTKGSIWCLLRRPQILARRGLRWYLYASEHRRAFAWSTLRCAFSTR